jgi:hypothetical protein
MSNSNLSKEIEVTLAVLNERTSHTDKTVSEIKRKLEFQYVTQEEFKPVKLIVYGLVGFIMTTVLGSLIAVVVRGVPQ